MNLRIFGFLRSERWKSKTLLSLSNDSIRVDRSPIPPYPWKVYQKVDGRFVKVDEKSYFEEALKVAKEL